MSTHTARKIFQVAELGRDISEVPGLALVGLAAPTNGHEHRGTAGAKPDLSRMNLMASLLAAVMDGPRAAAGEHCFHMAASPAVLLCCAQRAAGR